LWNDTHPLLHPEECTANELIEKSIDLAKTVKEIDPNAEVFGPALWGILPCIQAGTSENFTDAEWNNIKNNYNWYLDYYLESMAKAESETGKRLLDVVDVHYYSQDCSTDDGKLQAARSLYDESYVENSWLQPYFGGYFPLLPNIQKSIDKYYPGTKIAISEYNLADIANEKTTGKNVIAAIAETEALGAFAQNEVYFATYWGTLPECPYVESAINLYTNYDGEGSAFGDTLVEAKTEDLSKSAAFASIDGNADSDVKLVLSNKEKTSTEKASITIDGSSTDYKSAVVYAVTQDSSEIRIIDVQNDLSGNTIEVELPPLSVAQVVISDELTDKKEYEEPDITIKETEYNVSDLATAEDGSYIIPLGDKENLKEIIFDVNS
ncbi:MAG: glycoside hydrolase family 44 protein, partial [Oscillospiraceae bacterium]|nr:glycoside hydrolase family 44 protein [Oscillospiraceae bacterium]